VGIEPSYEGDGHTTPWTPRTVARAVPIMLALNQQYAVGWKQAEAYRDRFLREVEPLFDAVELSNLSDKELESWMPKLFDLHWEANGAAIKVSLLSTQAQDDFDPMVHRLNRLLPPEAQITEGDLITGLSDVGTARPTLELWDLAVQALADDNLSEIISASDENNLAAQLQATGDGRAFWASVEAFIRRNRYMAQVDEDLAQPRWDEDPTFALTMLRSFVRAGEELDPRRHLASQQLVRDAAEERALDALAQGWRRAWPFGRRSFSRQLVLVRRYVWWREELRVISAKAFYQCRRFFLELGERWAASGIIAEPDEIFLLRWGAIRDKLEGKLTPRDLRQQIESYHHLRTNYRNFQPPNVIGVGVGMHRLRPPAATGLRQLQGIPCSSGLVVGPARVACSLVEAQALQRGEILVAPYTNPGWTPLFNLAGGIIMEEGGLLSHGAVVAREYGIPSVLRIEGATRLFHTGQILALDGGRGTVEILASPDAKAKAVQGRNRHDSISHSQLSQPDRSDCPFAVKDD
jgi:phosphohistidine swiveling domain-containing protein